MNMASDIDLRRDLVRGTVCACTGPKKRRHSLCEGCFGRLSEGLQRALYDDAEYPAAYRRALTHLGLNGPQPANPSNPST